MKLKIYNQQGVLKATISPSDSDCQVKEVMNDNYLNLSFTLYEYIELGVNDYIDFGEERFTLLEDYKPEQNSTVEYVYNCKFYGIESELKKAKVLKLVDNENELSFSYNATAAEHLQLICDNINRIKGGLNWAVGEVVASGNINIEYNNIYCFDALSEIAKNFQTEWWIEGPTINLSRCEHGSFIPLGYGKGLQKLTRVPNDTVPFFTRLYPLGSTRNIVQSDYGYKRLQLPGGVKYVEQNTHLGIVEQSEESAFSGIYPRRIGKVSDTRSREVFNEEGEQYTIYYFKDFELNFDPNDYQIAAMVKNIVFQSGELNGRDFEVNYDSKTKEFEIITQYPYENQQIPGGMLIPKIDDEYILYNLKMPAEYYPLAEKEFEEAVQKHLQQISIDTSIYKAPTDYIYFDENNIQLRLGRRILLESAVYFPTGTHESRVTKISRKINNPNQMDIECTYAVDYGRVSQIENNIVDIQAAYKEQLNKDVLTVIKTWDSIDPTDYNVLSSKKALTTFLRKDKIDATKHLLRLLGGTEIGEAIDSLTAGKGIIADNNGRIQADRLELRSSLTVLELIFNRLSAVESDYSFSEAGTIESVELLSDGTYNLRLKKRWNNDFTAFHENDVIYGVVNELASAVGNYYTSWLRVLNVSLASNTINAALYPDDEVPGGSNNRPEPLMVLTRRGNPVDEDRQGFWYISSHEGCICMLDGVTKPILEESNYSVIVGKLKQLSLFDNLPINYKQSYVYCRGIAIQDLFEIDYQGNNIRKENNRGLWVLPNDESEPYQSTEKVYDAVYYLGCKWMCLTTGTIEEPKYASTGWAMIEVILIFP